MPERCIGTEPIIAMEETDMMEPAPAPKKSKPVTSNGTEFACVAHTPSHVPMADSKKPPDTRGKKPTRCRLAPPNADIGRAATAAAATMTPAWKGEKSSAS